MGLAADYRKASENVNGTIGHVDELFVTEWPRIHEYLSEFEVDGKERIRSTLTMRKDWEGYELTLSDTQFSRSISAIGKDWATCLSLLEEAICKPEPRWRYWGNMNKAHAIKKNRWSGDEVTPEADGAA